MPINKNLDGKPINKIDNFVHSINRKSEELSNSINEQITTSQSIKEARVEVKSMLLKLCHISGFFGISIFIFDILQSLISGNETLLQKAGDNFIVEDYYPFSEKLAIWLGLMFIPFLLPILLIFISMKVTYRYFQIGIVAIILLVIMSQKF